MLHGTIFNTTAMQHRFVKSWGVEQGVHTTFNATFFVATCCKFFDCVQKLSTTMLQVTSGKTLAIDLNRKESILLNECVRVGDWKLPHPADNVALKCPV